MQIDAIAPQCPASPVLFDAQEKNLPDAKVKEVSSPNLSSPVSVDPMAPSCPASTESLDAREER
eukprot:12417665-Karenia_brevis.AAC.1